MTDAAAGPVELALTAAVRILAVWLAASVLLLAVPSVGVERLLIVVSLHLSTVVGVGLVATSGLLVLTRARWFAGLSGAGERFATAAGLVALVVGVVALLTLASSAALRLAPSMQFLQLLSALDVAWVTSATMVGVSWMRGRTAGLLAGWSLAAICVWSIWNYLRVVGFDDEGGWIVDGGQLARLVLPFDLMAAIIAISVVVVGAKRAADGRMHPSV